MLLLGRRSTTEPLHPNDPCFWRIKDSCTWFKRPLTVLCECIDPMKDQIGQLALLAPREATTHSPDCHRGKQNCYLCNKNLENLLITFARGKFTIFVAMCLWKGHSVLPSVITRIYTVVFQLILVISTTRQKKKTGAVRVIDEGTSPFVYYFHAHSVYMLLWDSLQNPILLGLNSTWSII
jgi:hypothetical protein